MRFKLERSVLMSTLSKETKGIELSAETVRKITDSLLPGINKWRKTPLDKYIHLFSWTQFITR